MIEFIVDVSRLVRFRVEIYRLFDAGSGPGEIAMRQWGMRLRSYWQERFAEQSRGGGDWPELREATIAAKTRIGSRTPTSILRRFGPLFHSMDAVYGGIPGQYQERIPGGIEIGIGGPGSYPGGVTIGQVAYWHHNGEGRLPERTIIVSPSEAVLEGIADDLRRAIQKLLNES